MEDRNTAILGVALNCIKQVRLKVKAGHSHFCIFDSNKNWNTKMHKDGESVSYKAKKPHHVRRLSFGQTSLTSNVVNQFRDDVLLSNKNVTDIPCTKKRKFVFIQDETCIDYTLPKKETSYWSPILGTSVTVSTRTSPILGGRKHMKLANANRKENIRKNLFEPLSDTVPLNASPILGGNFHKRNKRRKPQRKVLNHIENVQVESNAGSPAICTKVYNKPKEVVSPVLGSSSYCYKRKQRKPKKENNKVTDNCVSSSVNTTDACSLVDKGSLKEENKWDMLRSQKLCAPMIELENCFEDDNLNYIPLCKDSNISEDPVVLDSSMIKIKLNIEDSPKDGEDMKIETESSSEDYDGRKDGAYISNDSDKDSSVCDYIEDTDTQHVGSFCKVASLHSQTSDTDSDDTFYSKAELRLGLLSNVRCSSQNISQTSTQITDIKSASQTEIMINTKTSPYETHTDSSTVKLNILDSGKKRRKPKRGSLMEKLQSMINRQISSVRIWRHRLKQGMKQNLSIPCVTVSVRTCITRFNRQFLGGVVVEDPFNLLSHGGRNSSVKFINIMIIPDVVGRIEMKFECLVQIFPPWETLDDKESTLNVTYIRVVPDCQTDGQLYKENLNQSRTLFIKDFHCRCIDENRMFPTCENRFNKPNIIEKLFID